MSSVDPDLPAEATTPAPADADVLARLRSGDNSPLEELYRRHRRVFLNWSGFRYESLSEVDRLDAFQQAVVTFYEQVASGRLRVLSASPATYVFRLADRHCQKISKKSGRTINISWPSDINSVGIDADRLSMSPDTSLVSVHSPDRLLDDPFGILLDDDTDDDAALARRERVQRGLRQLTADCRELLVAFYYHAQPLATLTAELGHRDEAVTRTRKSQCLKRLRDWCLPITRS